MIDPDADAVHPEAEKQRLSERQQADIAEQKVGAGGEQRPDQDFRDHADPERVENEGDGPGDGQQEHGEDRDQAALDEGAAGHFATPLNRPCGRNNKTALISSREVMRARVGLAKLCTMPSSSDSNIAAAAVP